MSKIDFLKTIYTKFIDENSVIFSIGLISNDEKTVLSQITNNLTHVKNLESDSNLCHIFSSIHDAITFCEVAKYDEIWIIGGSGIYNEFLETRFHQVHRAYITYVCPNGDDRENYECDTFIHIPVESYLIEEKTYNPAENCYYLTCVHKMHANDGKEQGLELLEDFIKYFCCQERDSNNLRIDS